jgi:hypothetical protein
MCQKIELKYFCEKCDLEKKTFYNKYEISLGSWLLIIHQIIINKKIR